MMNYVCVLWVISLKLFRVTPQSQKCDVSDVQSRSYTKRLVETGGGELGPGLAYHL